MNQQSTYLTKTIFMATCLTLGSTGSAVLGCGDSGGGPTVDSQMLGVYEVSSYQGSPEGVPGCEQMSDLEGSPTHVVLYSFLPNDKPDEALLGGVFCSSVDDCRQRAKLAAEPTVGWSFIQGSDEAGWLGWGISRRGQLNDQCQFDVQAHVLTSTSGEAIRIETKTFETVFMPTELDGNTATCSTRDALDKLNENPPCQAIQVLEATRAADL